MKQYVPDFNNVVMSARNMETPRLPLYEHLISVGTMEKITGEKFGGLLDGNFEDKKEFFRHYCGFFANMGYDTVSFEQCIGEVMPGSGCLGRHAQPAITDRDDFDKYPWDEIPDLFFNAYSENFKALGDVMPAGMKAIGGPGNGVFECVQEIVGFENLCYIKADDEILYADLFKKIGEINLKIWKRFLAEFGDIYCVLRFGDDLGYKSNTMLAADDVKKHIIPRYKSIIDVVHSYDKPFLLHSCGCIFDVMDDLINVARIDAKHSNEDQIAMFPYWVETYGDKIGNFGGIDTDAVCRLTKPELREYILDVIAKCKGHGGFAFGSGNSIPDYVPAENYVNMVEIVREYRRE